MKNLIQLYKYFKKYQVTFYIGFIFVILSVISGSYTPKLVKILIDDIEISLKAHNTDSEMILQMVLKFIFLYLLLTLISAVFTFLMRQTIVVASRKIEFELKNDLYKQYQYLDVEFFKRFQTGDLMSRISEDIGKVREFLGPALMYTFSFVTRLSITIYFMYQVNAELATYALIPLPFLSVFIFTINNKLYENNLQMQVNLAKLTSIAQESYNGIRIIKSFTQESNIYNQFSENSLKYKSQALKLVKIESLFQPVVTFLMSLSILIAILKGGQLCIDGKITLGSLTEFIMYVNMLTWPVMSIGWVAVIVQKASASMTRLDEIYLMPRESNVTSDVSKEYNLQGDIEFKNVSFRYPETGIVALDNVSFTIPFGERWLLVGKTGCGKTTVAELLMKFYTLDSGQILINKIPIDEIPNHWLRKQFSYVPQDVFLFSNTVEENIAFSGENSTFEAVVKAAKQAQIWDEIEHFKDKFKTLIGERGVTLSGGQKQRISIARALIQKTPFYLFDDCLSAVDVETEKNLINSLNETGEQSTSIIITHRIFNQLKFDKALVLQNGNVLEVGTHNELLEEKGLYYEFYTKQDVNNRS